MKKIVIGICASVLIVLAVLFVPIPRAAYDDGGTREYTALTYKIVKWNRIHADGVYDKTDVYFFGDRYKSVDELWAEKQITEPVTDRSFRATVVEKSANAVIVEPHEGQPERNCSDRFSFGTKGLQDIGAEVGSVVDITYTGLIREIYPASIDVTDWKIVSDFRDRKYTGTWLQPDKAEPYNADRFDDIIISEIYSDCFFAYPVIPMPYQIKFNGKLPDEWCVGDQVSVTCENARYDSDTNGIEADFVSIEASDFDPDLLAPEKPVIYLYPETQTDVTVKLDINGRLTCTYPAYGDGWHVTASPDGTLTDADGKEYSYLYWEGETDTQCDFSQGFCVRGEDTAAFLETALAELGLTRREANEFIVYWLPLMQNNAYNVISFTPQSYIDAAPLDISPAPDTTLRVFMVWYASDRYVQIEKQILTSPERVGFTVVEWGGSEIRTPRFEN